MTRCAICGAMIATNHEVFLDDEVLADPNRRRLAAAFFKGATYAHTGCLEKLMTESFPPFDDDGNQICAWCGEPVATNVEHYKDDRFTCIRMKPLPDETAPFVGPGVNTSGWWEQRRRERVAAGEEPPIRLPNQERSDRRAFLDALAARLEMGARDYDNASFDKPLPATVGELETEALDVAGWGYVLWVQIRRRCERLQRAVDELLQ